METNNFFQLVPGTEHFANIDMMIEYVKQCGTDGLIKVLENTKKFGYDLYQNTSTSNSILFTTNWDEEPRNIQDKETGEERFIVH